MSAKPAGESLENARKLYSIYARTAQYFGECFLYNSNSIGSLVFAKARLVRERGGPVDVTSLPYGYGRFLYQARGKAAILVKYVRFSRIVRGFDFCTFWTAYEPPIRC